MALPPPNTPLYNHTLPALERWLQEQGCESHGSERNRWLLCHDDWQAEIQLDVTDIVVCYLKAGADGRDIQRAFPYSLSRMDIEAAIFGGP
ncbi:DUF3143 domain-containing protein [Prochlorothrix hollandica]|uniref:DUF3143 domain-containing protein n=1 Tax=Prochlorothrix hollandica TaxID=1223 RepID=UPI00034D1BEA|nr:DUF3143 domain-containing protein [Prochlorothrix hollandica]